MEDRSAHRGERRILANIILDPGYQREPFDEVTLFIDTAGKSRAYWLDELARPLGVATQARRLGRRSAIVLGLAGGVTALSAVSAAGFLVRNQSTFAAAEATATAQFYGPGNELSGQKAYEFAISDDFAAAAKLEGGYPSIGIATDGTTLYAFAPDVIKALTPKGAEVWPGPIANFSDIQVPGIDAIEIPPPYAGSGIVAFQYVDSDNNDYLTVLDSRTRKTLWKKSSVTGNFSPTCGPVTVAGSSLYCIIPFQNDWSLCSFDRLSGKLNWHYSIGLGPVRPAAAYSAGHIYIGEPFLFDCLDATTGKEIWHAHLHTAVVATALVSGGLALFGGLSMCG